MSRKAKDTPSRPRVATQCGDEAEPYSRPDIEAVALAKELIERMSGRFEPEKMPDRYARAGQEL